MEATLDLNSLTLDDLLDEYKILNERYQQLKERSEEDTQRIYELKRNLATATAAEAYLSQELEQLSSQENCSSNYGDNKTQQDLDELRRKHKQLLSEHDILQQDHDANAEEIVELKQKLDEARKSQASQALPANTHADCMERQVALETENMELVQRLEQCADSSVQHTFVIAEKEKTIEILRDQVNCLEENMRCKRDELEEKVQILESAQDQLVEANAKIAELSAAPAIGQKGNSLFAEVDEHRQAMKQQLAAQKKSYMQMKKCYTESEYEIRRLKRENIAMHGELQICSSIFCKADKTYQDKLNERIRHLNNQNEMLERKLNWTQERLKDLAIDKSVLWLDSMLNFCKQETDDLKKQLHSVRIQKASLEEQLRNSQQDLARWRFESLKSRCVLIDRENLLTEHKVSFKPNNAIEFNIKEAEMKLARPRIVNVLQQHPTQSTPTTTPNKIVNRDVELMTNIREEHHTMEIKVESTVSGIRVKNIALINSEAPKEPSIDPKMEIEDTEVKVKIETEPSVEIKTEFSINQNNDDIIEIEDDTPMKPRPPTPPKSTGKLALVASAIKSNKPSAYEQTRSILTTKRDIFAEDTKKSVQFSVASPVVHILSPPTSDTGGDEGLKENKRIINDTHVKPKSKVIVKRIIVGSRHERRQT